MADDVAYALLDATRRMSISRGRSDSFGSSGSRDDHNISSSVGSGAGGGWFDSWKSSTDLDAKTDSLHSLPKDTGSWFPAHRNRAYSESASDSAGKSKFGAMGGWFAAQGNRPGFTARKLSEMALSNETGSGAHQRLQRKPSHKDVEEAMAGGLNKADIYMPPM